MSPNAAWDTDGAGESDSTLIERSLIEPELFAALFDRHSDEMFRYTARRLGPEIAEDTVADLFLVAFRGRAKYDRVHQDARPWLYGIATNLIARQRRAERRRTKAMARVAVERPSSFHDGADDRLTAERFQPKLAKALASLSAAERDLLLLVAWANLTYDGAARALGIPEGTARSRLHRVRSKVRRALGGVNPFTVEPLEPQHG
ncbi:RNA polymerase sigma-70 factor, ECF subfamily [Sinosporangium album]|uniref:RNA polymerase sigma-70 factor, ECF subfamily n=1 Tax=Sinosporangium album TaxID=504805 RepID=A0A1G7Z2X4_9ACTN|nr:RNA polymerase sigma factor [Sinosporangium album]SDH03053.1 RNA polymerase sigma-70 factor, ECF subfamily [Sinosporangium album]